MFLDNFPIENGLNQGGSLLPLLFNFAIEYTIMKVLKDQMGVKLTGTRQLLSYADDANLLGDSKTQEA
jgi:hypothetical protein